MAFEKYTNGQHCSNDEPIVVLRRAAIGINSRAIKEYGLVETKQVSLAYDTLRGLIAVVPEKEKTVETIALLRPKGRRQGRISATGFIRRFGLGHKVSKSSCLLERVTLPPDKHLKEALYFRFKGDEVKRKIPAAAAVAPVPKRLGRPPKSQPDPTDTEAVRAAVAAARKAELFYECTGCGEGPKEWKQLDGGHPAKCPKCNGPSFEKTPREYLKPANSVD